VTVISGYSRLLLSEEVGPLNPAQRRFLEGSFKSCKRIDTFIGNLIEAAREAAGEGGVHLVAASLEAAIHGVVQFLKPLLEEGDLRLETHLAPDASHAWFDPMRLEQVLSNLLGNAVKYARRGGCVEIATRVAGGGDQVEVSVSDDGLGIAPEDRERIFEPYVRSDEARSAGGLGLGLAICRRLVEAHGGRITVDDRPGGGSCFRFTLRRAAPPEAR
jgi:signal transduction histidine kinase